MRTHFLCIVGLTGVAIALASSVGVMADEPTHPWNVRDASVTDASRGNRRIDYRLRYPTDIAGPVPVILISHGGDGAYTGHLSLQHLGAEYATYGYLAIHLNHRPSSSLDQHLIDRPLDVSFVIDRLEDGTFPLPADFPGTPDLTRIGHIGHSFGAYTAHALAGSLFDNGSGFFLDPRIGAFCPLSPQGRGKFGFYDTGPENNSWMAIDIPMFNLYGALEETGGFELGWRGQSFDRYPEIRDKFEAVVADADHSSMGNDGTPEQNAYVVRNTRLFYDVFLKGELEKICEIGQQNYLAGTSFATKFDVDVGTSRACIATGPSPADGATDVGLDDDLTWQPGPRALAHDVSFGTDAPPPFAGRRDVPSFDPGPLAPDTLYHWRIDDVGLGGGWQGRVWSFRTGADADGDRAIDARDNCMDVANADQADADGDGAGDACDCAPEDGGVQRRPEVVAGVWVAGSAPTQLSWPAQGDADAYDVARGSLGMLLAEHGTTSATCAASDIPGTTWEDAASAPAPGDAYYYIVRARNLCGPGSYGAASDGRERQPVAGCP